MNQIFNLLYSQQLFVIFFYLFILRLMKIYNSLLFQKQIMIQFIPKPEHPYSKMDENNKNISPLAQGEPEKSPYFKLIAAVGTHNRYQIISMIIWCILWLTTGTILLGTPFIMFNPPYVCPTINNQVLTSQQCQTYVCALPQEDRVKFIDQDQMLSIANSFSDLHCQKSWIVDLLSSMVYLGSFFGYISISIMVDNMGRKRAILISSTIAAIGMILLALAPNFVLIGIGFFFMGYGADSAVNICFYFITETMEAQYRQKYSILIQVFFCLGGITNIAYYYILKNWKLVVWLFLVTPSILCVLAIFKIVKDTPYFLIKLKNNQQILEELKFIYKLNNKGEEMNISKQNQIKELIVYLKKYQAESNNTQENKKQNIQSSSTKQEKTYKHKIFTPLDLFRYKSIRFTSIAICALSFFIYTLYYGPLMLINKFSFDIYTNALVITLSELITYPLSYFYIHKIPRKKIGMILYGISGAITFSLIFIIAAQCDQAKQWYPCHYLKVLELVLIFIFRFCSSLEFAIFLVYTNEAFPTQIRGIGVGISSALGTVASTASPYIFGSSIKTNEETSRIMIVFVVISVIGVILWWRLKQTLNMPIADEIEQVKDEVQSQTERKHNKIQGGHIELIEVRD